MDSFASFWSRLELAYYDTPSCRRMKQAFANPQRATSRSPGMFVKYFL